MLVNVGGVLTRTPHPPTPPHPQGAFRAPEGGGGGTFGPLGTQLVNRSLLLNGVFIVIYVFLRFNTS